MTVGDKRGHRFFSDPASVDSKWFCFDTHIIVCVSQMSAWHAMTFPTTRLRVSLCCVPVLCIMIYAWPPSEHAGCFTLMLISQSGYISFCKGQCRAFFFRKSLFKRSWWYSVKMMTRFSAISHEYFAKRTNNNNNRDFAYWRMGSKGFPRHICIEESRILYATASLLAGQKVNS